MKLGGIGSREQSQQVARYSGFFVPVLLVLYGILIQYEVVESAYFASNTLFYILMASWVLLGAYQFLVLIKSKRTAIFRITAYHAFGAIYFLFISGFAMPFVQCWALLTLATFAFFSYRGLALSILTFLAIAVVDTLLHQQIAEIALNNLFAVTSTLIIGLSVVALTRAQETDSRELEQSREEERLQRDSILTLINNLADAVMSTDKNGVVRVYNAASLGLLDTNGSLSGKHIDDIVKLNDTNNKPVSLFNYLKKAKSVAIIDTLNTVIGEENLRIEVTYSPIRSSYSRSKKSDLQDGYIIILRDVTKAKSLEEERDEFISVVSHELRTPITIAEGTISNAQLMFERDDIHDDILKAGLETAHEQVVFLAKMVNDLSTLSRAERGVADAPETIEVKALIESLHAEYAPEAEKKGLRFNIDSKGKLGTVSSSRLYLHELLQNFITNSIKYTKEGSVTLHTELKDDIITFTVKDTGIGISKSDQIKIFNKFYRSEDYRTRETGGTGLGLYVATKLAKKLGCHIALESRLNHGSSFSFSLPIKK